MKPGSALTEGAVNRRPEVEGRPVERIRAGGPRRRSDERSRHQDRSAAAHEYHRPSPLWCGTVAGACAHSTMIPECFAKRASSISANISLEQDCMVRYVANDLQKRKAHGHAHLVSRDPQPTWPSRGWTAWQVARSLAAFLRGARPRRLDMVRHPGGPRAAGHHGAHGSMITVGDVDGQATASIPTALLTDWETGKVSSLPDGRTLRTFVITGEDKEIEIAPGIFFPAWTYNGRVPGPTPAGHRRRPGAHSSSATTARTPTRCTSTASTRRGWTASLAPARSAPARNSPTSSTRSRSAAISITAMPCR